MPMPKDNRKVIAVVATIQLFMGFTFVMLKLFHQLPWSWWQVTAPFWAPWGIIGTMIGIVALIERVIDP